MREAWVWSLGWEDPLEENTATHSSILAWKIPWTEEPGGLQSTGSQRVEHEWTYTHTAEFACLSQRQAVLPCPFILAEFPPRLSSVLQLIFPETINSVTGCAGSSKGGRSLGTLIYLESHPLHPRRFHTCFHFLTHFFQGFLQWRKWSIDDFLYLSQHRKYQPGQMWGWLSFSVGRRCSVVGE